MKKPWLWIGLFFVSIAAPAETIRLSYDFEGFWDGESWTGEWERVPGYPEAPRVVAKVLLPPGGEIEGVRFTPHSRAMSRPMRLNVVPEPRPLCNVGWTPPVAEPPRRGAQTHDHLGEPVVATQRGHRIAFIPLYPVRWDDESGLGHVISGGELEVFTSAGMLSELHRGLDDDRMEVESIVDNPEALADYPSAVRKAQGDYLVIAPKAYFDDTHAEALEALLAEKRGRGLVVISRTAEDITANEPGRDSQEKIRNAITRHYKDDGIRFVLLVGNGHSVLPTRKLKVNMSEGTIYSDFYFACLDGNYDNNKNNVFGETKDGVGGKDVDLAGDVAVGRAPVSSLADMHAFVRKSLQFAAVAYYDPRIWSSLLFGEKLDDKTLGGKNLDQLANGGQAGHIATQGYPAVAKLNKYYETFSKSFTADQAIETISSGDYYTLNHLGHANEEYCMRFASSRIPELKNALPFFGITQGCHPGNLKGPNWASKLVVSPNGGAAAMVANSNYGWYSPGSEDGPSNRFHLAFYDTVFRDGERFIGWVHYRAKTKMIPDVTSATIMRWVVYETNLLGDPELEFRF